MSLKVEGAGSGDGPFGFLVMIIARHRRSYPAGKDTAMIELDDLTICRFTQPPLTTIQFSPKELAGLAFAALLEEIQRVPKRLTWSTRRVLFCANRPVRYELEVPQNANADSIVQQPAASRLSGNAGTLFRCRARPPDTGLNPSCSDPGCYCYKNLQFRPQPVCYREPNETRMI